jgi:hypothetical protein
MLMLSSPLNINLINNPYNRSIYGALIIIDGQARPTSSYDHHPLANPCPYSVYSYERLTDGFLSSAFQRLNNLYLTADQKFMFAGGNDSPYYLCN